MDIFGYNLNDASDCAEIVELNDRFIRRYTEVIERYGMLPACGEVLYEQVKKEFPQRFVDYLDAVNSFVGFNYLAPPCNPECLSNPEWLSGVFEEDAELPPEEQAKEDERIMSEEGAHWWRKLAVLYRRMLESVTRQMLDWSNIYGVGLTPDARQEGMQILFLLGHLLGLSKTCMYASDYCANRMAIQLVEQGMKEISRIELLIDELQRKMPMLTSLFRGRRDGIESVRKLLQVYKEWCEKYEDDLNDL